MKRKNYKPKKYKHTLKFYTGGRAKSWRTFTRQVAVINGGIRNKDWNNKYRINLYAKFPERWKALYHHHTPQSLKGII